MPSMSSWVEWPRSLGQLRAVEEAPVAVGVLVEHDRRELLDAVPDRHQPRHVLLDELQRRQHMGDALAGEVLEIAGLENLHHAILDVVGEPLSWPLLSAADSVLAAWSISSAACRIDCVARSVPPTMAASSRPARAICSLPWRFGAERGHLVPGALDRGVDQAEFVLVGLRLGDLRPRPLQRVAVDRRRAARSARAAPAARS